MALGQSCLLLRWIILFMLFGWMIADINYGDCDKDQIEQIRTGLQEAQDMATVSAERLEELLELVRQPQIDALRFGQNARLTSTFNTYSFFVDERLKYIYNIKDVEKRKNILLGIHEILHRSACLRDNLAHVLNRPVNTNSRTKPVLPNINFQCSQEWLIDVEEQNEVGRLFRDARTKAQGGPTDQAAARNFGRYFNIRGNNLPFDELEFEQAQILVVNDLLEPFSSVLTINPDLFQSWTDLASGDNEYKPTPLRGEASFHEMRDNNAYTDRQFPISNLTRYHASSDLLTTLAESSTMGTYSLTPPGSLLSRSLRGLRSLHYPQRFASAPLIWPPDFGDFRVLPEEGDHCMYEGQDVVPESWGCLRNMSSIRNRNTSYYRPDTYRQLTAALYLDNYDWHNGSNLNIQSQGVILQNKFPEVPPQPEGLRGMLKSLTDSKVNAAAYLWTANKTAEAAPTLAQEVAVILKDPINADAAKKAEAARKNDDAAKEEGTFTKAEAQELANAIRGKIETESKAAEAALKKEGGFGRKLKLWFHLDKK